MGLKSMFRRTLDGALLRKDVVESMELSKHFKVIKVLGRGSYSTVYEVERRSDGLRYALKATDVGSLNARERRDMVNEIRLLASLQHPNLLVCYEAFCDKQTLCIVTELATGGDLGTLIDKRADAGDLLPERQVWSYFLQIALALQYLHHSHVLHRDIKPQNILVSSTGLLKVADLGIAQVLDTVFTRALIGTPYYMSPEMWQHRPYSYSADVWALGCILYELCALKPLFMAREEKAIKQKVLSGLLEALPPRYSLDLWEVMRSMLTLDPAQRPTIDEILQMPAVRSRLSLVPEEDRPLLARVEVDRVMLLQPIQIPRMSSDWERINAFLPPSKYANGGKGVVDSLRLKASSSCPELLEGTTTTTQGGLLGGPGGAGPAGGGGRGGEGGAGLFGPATGLRFQFGEVTAQGMTRGRGQTEPEEVGTGAFRKIPSDTSIRGTLMRSHTITVGQVFEAHHGGGLGRESPGGGGRGGSLRRGGSPDAARRGGGGGEAEIRAGGAAAGVAAEGTGGAVEEEGGGGGERVVPQALPQDSREVARVVAEAWERAKARGAGGNGVTGRRSISVAQVLLHHTAADDYEAAQQRHEQEREALMDTVARFSPAPLELCPATGSQRPAAAHGAAAAASAPAAEAPATAAARLATARPASAALHMGPGGAAAGSGVIVEVGRGKGAPEATQVGSSPASPAASPLGGFPNGAAAHTVGGAKGSPSGRVKSVAWVDEVAAPPAPAEPAAGAQPGAQSKESKAESKGWGEEAPAVKRGKKKLFGFLRKLGSRTALSEM